MSLVVSVYTREGIVMAADSRLTLTYPRNIPGQLPHTVSVTTSDSARKLFLTPNHIGISTFGAAAIKGAPVAGVIESFIVEKIKGSGLPPKETAEALLAYLTTMSVSQITNFHVAGYRSDGKVLTQEALLLDLSGKTVTQMNVVNRNEKCTNFRK